jgi:hypothetical protein
MSDTETETELFEILSSDESIFFIPCLQPRLPMGSCVSKDNGSRQAMMFVLEYLPCHLFDEVYFILCIIIIC